MSNENFLFEEAKSRFKRTAAYLEGELESLYREGVLTEVDWIKLKEDSKLSAQAVVDALNRTDYPPDMQRTLVAHLIDQYELSAERILEGVRKRQYSTERIEKRLKSIERDVFRDLFDPAGQGTVSKRSRNEILHAIDLRRSDALKSIKALRVDSPRIGELLATRFESYRFDLEKLAAKYRSAIPQRTTPLKPSPAPPVEQLSQQGVPMASAEPIKLHPKPQSSTKTAGRSTQIPATPRIENTNQKQANRPLLVGLGFLVVVCSVCIASAFLFSRVFLSSDFPAKLTSTPTRTSSAIIYRNYEGLLLDIPEEMLLKVRQPITLNVEDAEVAVTLQGYEQIRLQDLGANKTRIFRTQFEVKNPTERDVILSVPRFFSAANNSGRYLSQGGGVALDTRGNVLVKAGANVPIILDWHTLVRNAVQGQISSQRVFIVVNTLINDNLDVTIDKDSAVFVVDFPEIP